MKLKVIRDDNPISPREWDNIGKMICFHKRYTLGDGHDYKSTDFDGREHMHKELKKVYDGVILPLYLYDHSGITMSTRPFGCPWDSGQVGYLCVSKDDIRNEFSRKKSPRI